jgi:hypothetical protein
MIADMALSEKIRDSRPPQRPAGRRRTLYQLAPSAKA